MALTQPIKQGLDSTTLRNVPKEWDAEWFRRFMVIQLKAADARNTIAGVGISITGSFDRPGVISCTGPGGGGPIAPFTILGNDAASPGPAIPLSEAQVTAMLDVFSSGLQGLVPPSGGGTVNYLRADGSFAMPPGFGGTVTSVSGTALQIDVVNGTTTPVISIDPGYVGQTSITTLGTVTTGTWSGTRISIARGGTGQATAAAAYSALSPMTTTGDIEYEASTATAARLPIGATGNVLTVVGGIPAWAAPATSGTVTSVSGTALQIDVVNGTTTPVISIDAGYVGQTSITTLGTVTTGTWSGTTIAIARGGTGQVTAAAAYTALSPMTTTGDIEYEVSAGVAGRLAIGATGNVLTVVGGIPAWVVNTAFGGFANPSGLIGLTAVNGVATTAERSDSTHALDQSITPTWTGLHTFNPTSGNAIVVNGDGTTSPVNIDANNVSLVTSFDSTSTNGPYIRITRSGTVVGEMGSAKELVTGGLIGDFALVAGGTTNSLVFGTDGLTAMVISSARLVTGFGTTAAGQVDMSPDSSTFTGTFTGMVAVTTGTMTWKKMGALVTLYSPTGLIGTSNANTFTMTGLPAVIQPGTGSRVCAGAFVNGGNSDVSGRATFAAGSGTVNFGITSSTGGVAWNAGGNKGFLAGTEFTYAL
jgi:hypothetical protein